MTEVKNPNPDCLVCAEYMLRRINVLPAHIVRVADRRGISPKALAVEYMNGVHERHQLGFSLEVTA